MTGSRWSQVIALSLFLIGLSGAGQIGAQELALREVAATKGSAQVPFGVINDMLEIADGRILVTDDVVGVVHAWVPERNTVVRFARNGQGPGEVTVPSRMAVRGDGDFGIYDVSASAVLLFDAGGQLLNDGSFVIAGGRLTDPRHLHRYSEEGRYLGSYGGPHPHLEEQMPLIQAAGGALRSHPEGGFVFSHGAPLRIERFPGDSFDDPDQITEDLSVLPELREEEVYERSPDAVVFRWWHDRSTGIVVLPDGRILNVITRFYEGDSIWDLYSPNGTLEVRRVIDRPYYLYGTTADGRLLASYRDEVTDEHAAVILELQVPR